MLGVPAAQPLEQAQETADIVVLSCLSGTVLQGLLA
jgi:hypothetical protein